ncbi:hypothetical protein UO65_4033 [Actinokineospora spheciospongiae]|uniref:Uncharacterized protein n=1 Tax=Actinokineospora spheciospongiae TaxID=909613 RepID=W7IJ04_9PSEU|nr:hypothetical protein UO65_4033 [Actinokineospora spheciospongiae]
MGLRRATRVPAVELRRAVLLRRVPGRRLLLRVTARRRVAGRRESGLRLTTGLLRETRLREATRLRVPRRRVATLLGWSLGVARLGERAWLGWDTRVLAGVGLVHRCALRCRGAFTG